MQIPSICLPFSGKLLPCHKDIQTVLEKDFYAKKLWDLLPIRLQDKTHDASTVQISDK